MDEMLKRGSLAILSCNLPSLSTPVRRWYLVQHSHHPVDWEAEPQPHPLAAREPRKGRRLTLAADIQTPKGDITVYCAHLEVRDAPQYAREPVELVENLFN